MKLHAAIEAVRAESAEGAVGASATRRRVLAAVERSPRRQLHVVVAAVIASMFGASAFAYYAKAPRATPAEVAPPAPVASAPLVEAVIAPRRASARVAPPVVTPAEVAPPVVAPAKVAPPVVAPETAIVEARRVEPASIVTPAPAHAASAPVPPAPTPELGVAAAVQRDPELAMYAEAHALHFHARDMAAALTAWNRYLAAAPDGKLAPEARFNRVVALVKLQRWSDANRALDALASSPFRAGDLARLRAVVSSHLGRTR